MKTISSAETRWLMVALVVAGSASCGSQPEELGPAENDPAVRTVLDGLQAELTAAEGQNAFASPFKRVKPVLKCVEKVSPSTYKAHFGYANGNSTPTSIPVGFNNRFWPEPINRGQPSTFAPTPRAHDDVLQVTFSGSSASVWILGNTLAVATRYSRQCPTSTGTGGAAGAGGIGGRGGAAGAGGGASGGAGGAGGAITCVPPSSCDDRNPCTVEAIDFATCSCVHVAVQAGTACSDGNACTTGDACDGAGVCAPGTPRSCSASDSCHLAGVCNPATGACSNPPAADGTSCSDGDMCTIEERCLAGVCTPQPAYPPTTCDSPCAQCERDNCFPSTDGCELIVDPIQRSLCVAIYSCFVDPANHCATDQGDPFPCWCGTHPTTCASSNSGPDKANGPCLDLVTEGAGLTPATYDALTIKNRVIDPDYPLGRAVRLSSCLGTFCGNACPGFKTDCTNPLVPDGTPCDDGNACTVGEACQAGACTGVAKACAPSDACHLAGVCQPATGLCTNPVAPDGRACQGISSCGSVGLFCRAGFCGEGQLIPDCFPLCQACQAENCSPATDGCDGISNPADKSLCESILACFVDPANNCTFQGDAVRCWCGTSLSGCTTVNSGAGKANGPCLDLVTRGAGLTPATYDAPTIKNRIVSPNFPLGRAINGVSCEGLFCSQECHVP